ncbi:MAG: Ca-activated chloride channel family protein [Halioglobus sp.]|jgi:Ca-activated chloride channel family protein
MIGELHLMRPEWLWCLIPAFLLALILGYLRRRSGSWSEIIAPELLPYLIASQAGSRRHSLLPLILLAWIVASIAAAGPAWKKIPQPIQQKQDALVLVLDLSYSMQAQDVSPSRTIRAQQKLLDLLGQRAEGQTGLIAYAGDAHIVTPLTDDNPTIANLIPALNPGMMPVLGSDPASAILLAIDLLHSGGITGGKILLITDGVDTKSSEAIGEALAGKNIALAVMGVGTPTGAPIPLPQGGFIKDKQGNIVVPALNEPQLRALASDSRGNYAKLSLDDRDLDYLLSSNVLLDNEQTVTLDRTADAWEDQGYLLVLFLLPISLALFRRGWIICLLPMLLFFAHPETAMAQSWDDLWLTADQQGRKALLNEENTAAAVLFEDPNWAGTASYREQEYDQAIEAFSKTKTADSVFNLGNAQIRAGNLDEAIAAYRHSLEILPEQPDAIENLALAENLKEQQEQQQDDNGDSQEGQDQQQEQNQQDSSDEQEQSEGQSDPSESEESPEQTPPEDDESSEENESESEGKPEDEDQNAEPEDGNEQEQEVNPAGAEEKSPEDKEQEQAMQQWLRRIPDDPSGLLREKFRYESRQREQLGNGTENDTNW